MTSEPFTYRKDNAHAVSYFRDLVAMQVPGASGHLLVQPEEARRRFERHGLEIDTELPKRERAGEARANASIDRAETTFQRSIGSQRQLDVNPFEIESIE